MLLVTAGDNPERMRSESSFAGVVWRKSCPGVLGTDHTAPFKPRWEPPGQQRPLAYRYHPHAIGPRHHRLRPKKKSGRQNPKRDHPLPETSHRPRDLPPAHQPTKNTQRQRPTLPTPPSPGNPYPRRSSAPHPSKSHLRTRTRPIPQPPTSHPLSKMAHRERSTTKPCEYVGGALRVCQARRSGGVVTLQNPDRFCLYRPVRVFKLMCPTPSLRPPGCFVAGLIRSLSTQLGVTHHRSAVTVAAPRGYASPNR